MLMYDVIGLLMVPVMGFLGACLQDHDADSLKRETRKRQIRALDQQVRRQLARVRQG